MPVAKSLTTHLSREMRPSFFTISAQPAPVLPAVPSTTALHQAVRARLDVLSRDVLPMVRAEREFLSTVWCSEAPDAHVLYLSDERSLACDAVGADRLSAVLATEEALVREATALDELLEALDDYEAGGRQARILSECLTTEDEAADADLIPRQHHHVQSRAPLVPVPSTGRAFTRKLQAYLAVIETDASRALATGAIAEAERYSIEGRAVRERLARHTRHGRPRSTGQTERPSALRRSA